MHGHIGNTVGRCLDMDSCCASKLLVGMVGKAPDVKVTTGERRAHCSSVGINGPEALGLLGGSEFTTMVEDAVDFVQPHFRRWLLCRASAYPGGSCRTGSESQPRLRKRF